MKIYIFGSKRVGGVRIITTSIADSLKNLGYEVQYIFGFRVIKFYLSRLFEIFLWKKNKYYFITWGIYNLLPLPTNKTISFLHGFPSYNQQDLLRYSIFRFIIFSNRFRKIKTISISKYSQSILEDIFNLKTKLVRNTIPFNFIKNLEVEDLEKDLDIIFVGRANKYKLPNYIIECLEILAKRGLNIYVIGDGISKDNYLKNNLDTKIKFLDFISHDKVISFLKRSKYFISCSSSEPFGIVFLEALLYGCKTISPRSGGLLEISSIFPENNRDLFNFYDNEKNAKEILFGLDFSTYISKKEDQKEIINILKNKFNPISHAKELVEILRSLEN